MIGLIDDNAMDNKYLVILADNVDTAVNYGRNIRSSPMLKILPIYRRAEIYLLYGHRNMPFAVVPGTIMQDWHAELDTHIQAKRIIPIVRYKTVRIS